MWLALVSPGKPSLTRNLFAYVDQEIAYLLEESLEYQISRGGKIISLIEELGLVIDVPPGAIPDDHPDDDVILKINACVRGPFELPDQYELASPVFHIEPGVKLAKKPIELSIVHFIDIKDKEDCGELSFVSAPLKQSSGKAKREGKVLKFKPLERGMFWPGRRIGKIALQHFCLVGIAQSKGEKRTSETAHADQELSSITSSRSVSSSKMNSVSIDEFCIHNFRLSNAILYKLLSWEIDAANSNPVQSTC